MIVLGCDPGTTGALAAMTGEGVLLSVVDMPIRKRLLRGRWRSDIDEDAIVDWFAGHKMLGARHFACERVGGLPGQGAPGAFNFGYGFGSVLMAARMLHYETELIDKARWANPFHVGGGTSGKRQAVNKARELWPDAMVDDKPAFRNAKSHGRAEACLIALWGVRYRWCESGKDSS